MRENPIHTKGERVVYEIGAFVGNAVGLAVFSVISYSSVIQSLKRVPDMCKENPYLSYVGALKIASKGHNKRLEELGKKQDRIADSVGIFAVSVCRQMKNIFHI